MLLDDLCSFPRQTIQYHSNPSLCPTSNAEEAEVEQFYENLQDLLELTPKKDVLFIIGDWNAKVGSQETPRVTGAFGLGAQNEAGRAKANRVLPRGPSGHGKQPLPTTQETAPHGGITRFYIFAVKGGVALYSQQKQYQELTMVQIMNSLLPNTD